MTGIYFSGTGNTKFCVDTFLKEYGYSTNSFSIEDNETLGRIENENEIVIGYPVQYSNIPKIVKDYIIYNRHIWKGKSIFIIATMGLFSGDGAGILARLLKNYGAIIVGGLHLKMPDSICDEKALKRSFEENKKIIIEETLSTLMNKLDLEETLPYTVKHELKTSLYFGCSRNSYNDFLEHIISDEVKRRINNISCKIKVFASILTKEDGYYYLGEFWTPTSAPYRVMCIKIVLDF